MQLSRSEKRNKLLALSLLVLGAAFVLFLRSQIASVAHATETPPLACMPAQALPAPAATPAGACSPPAAPPSSAMSSGAEPFHGHCRCTCSRVFDCNTSADCGGSPCLGAITCC